MEIQGRVENGVVVFSGGQSLPEGTVVSVVYPKSNEAEATPGNRSISLPLVHCQQPGSVQLTSDRIARILDAEDIAPRH